MTDRGLPTERWSTCELGHVHWGARGGAGLLLRCATGDEPTYLLARRSRQVDESAMWGIPGGAIKAGESPDAAARRETSEEIGTVPAYRVTEICHQDCGGGWVYHVICADVEHEFEAFCLQETDATGWFTRTQMRRLPLHSGVRAWLAGDPRLKRGSSTDGEPVGDQSR
jgi:8-oxo-dGTP pyrophosphatase MutT (NUDIX family)